MSYQQGKVVLRFSFFLLSLLVSGIVVSDTYPPLWNNGDGAAIHYQPVAWPSEPSDPANCGADCGEWKPYTRFQNNLADPRIKDPSNGGTSPQSYVNVASSCIDKSLPSIYYSLRQGDTPAEDVLMFRWRVESSAHTYATGKNAGSAGATAPWSSALWTVFFDLDGSGYRSLAAHLDGSIGSPSEQIDLISGIWSNTASHSLDYVNDANIHLLDHNPTAFIGDNNKILNFADNLTPTENWPNGSAETSWDYGTTRAKLVSKNSCNEYFIDYQIPVKMLDASGKVDSEGNPGPSITRDTPISMMFCSANSLNNPLQKDCAVGKEWLADPSVAGPFGDYLSFNQTKPYSQPIISNVDAVAPNTCPGSYTLNATVQDTLALQSGVVIPSIKSVDFYYWYDVDGDGAATAADTDSEWIKVSTPGTLDGSTLNSWSAPWDSTSLPKGKFLIGVQALDDNTKIDDDMVASGIDNRTISYLSGDIANEIHIAGSWITGQQALFPQHSPALTPSANENWYGNPAVTGQQIAILGTAINACGLAPAISLTANETNIAAGETVGYSITVTNPADNTASITVNSISDVLPNGFSYQLSSTTGEITTNPTESGQILDWTFSSPVSLSAGDSLIINFNATATTTSGTYNNNASAVTSFGELDSDPVAISVDSARLSLAITPDSYSVAADDSDEITFTIHYANDSVVPVTNASITSSIISGLNYVSCNGGSSCALSTNTITWTLGDIAAGLSGDVSYTITVANTWASPSLTASATLSATAPDSSAVSVNASTTVAVTGVSAPSVAVMSLNKTANLVQVAPGGNIVYTLNYQNDGSATAADVVIVDTLPSGLTFTSCTGGCAENTGVITWAIGTVVAGASGNVTINVAVADPFIEQNPSVNNATIDWTDGVQLTTTLNVGITGQTCNTYYFSNAVGDVGFDSLQNLANISPVTTEGDTGSTLTITVPTGGGYAAQKLAFYQGTVSTTDIRLSGDITTLIYIDRANGGGLDVRGTLYDYDSSTGTRIQLGQTVNGLNDFLSFLGSSKGLLDDGSGAFTVPVSGTLAKGHRLLWEFEAKATLSSKTYDVEFQYGGTVTNGISGGTTPAIANAYFCYTPPANLVLSKSVDDTSINASDAPTLTYATTYANTGAIATSNVQLIDVLPANFTGCEYSTDNSTWASCSGAELHSFTLGTVSAGSNGKVYIRGAVPAGTSSGDILTSTVTASSTETLDVTASADTSVMGGGVSSVAELSLNFSSDLSNIVPGNSVTYTVTVTNIGGGDATNIVVTNALPITNYYSFTSCSDSCSNSADTISWNVGNLAAGTSQTFTYVMSADTTSLSAGITTINDDAFATGDALSSVTSNEVSVSLTGNPLLDLSVTASPNNNLNPNDEVTYSISISNLGSATATSVVVVTPIPAYMSYVGTINASVGSGIFDTINNQVVFTLGDMASLAPATLSFITKVSNNLASGNTTTTFTSTASAANSLQKIASATISADAAPVLTLLKTQSGTTAYPAATLTADVTASTTVYVDSTDQFSLNQLIKVDGTAAIINSISSNSITLDRVMTASSGSDVIGSISLSMTYRNTGNATATNVSLTEVLAAELRYYSAYPSADSAPTVGNSGSLVWNIGELAAGEFTSKTVTVFPDGTQGSFTSTATINADNAAAVNASVVTSIGGLSVAKSTSTRYVAPGGEATYKITLKNTLSTNINNVSVTELLENGFAYQANSAIVDGSAIEPTFAGADSAKLQPIWSNLTVLANSSFIIDFSVDISVDIGAATYQNELNVTLPANTGIQTFNPLTTTAEDVTILGDGYGVITGYVFNRIGASGNSYVAGNDTALANVQVNIHQNGNDCTDLYSVGCYIAVTDNNGYFEKVVQAGDWYLDVQSGSGDLNAAWSQTIGTNDNLITVVSQNFIQDHNGFALVASHTVNSTAGTGGTVGPTSRSVVEGNTTTFTVTPDAGYSINTVTGCNGTLSGVTYTTDAITADCTVTASFTLNAVNVIPVANNQTISTSENSPLTITLSGTDSDGSVVSYQVGSPAHGTLSGTGANVIYTPTGDFDGSDSFTFTVTDNEGGISPRATVNITVLKVNMIPIANNDDVEVLKNSQNNIINVLSNDTDSDGDELTVTEVAAVYGTVAINNDGSLSYTSLNESAEIDILTYTISDNKGGIASAVVTVTITVIENKPPVAVDDSYTFTSFEPVTLDVLANDSDPENDPIELVAVQVDVGHVEIVDGVVIYTPEQETSGIFTITYSIQDSAGNIATAKISVRIESDNGPLITLPEDLCGDSTVNADALYTRVDLGEASAIDRFGNPVPVSLIDGLFLYPPGLNEAFWQATDIEGNTTIEKQLVCVTPLVSIEKDQTLFEGEAASIRIYLNGESPVYPLVIPYEVQGNENDHDLISGEVIVESGTETQIQLNTLVDDEIEEDETVQVILSNSLNLGAKYVHSLVITEGNIAPAISLKVIQNHLIRFITSQTDGLITVKSTINDPNLSDNFTYQWQISDNSITNQSAHEKEFIFDPSELAVGLYSLKLTVTDSGIPTLSDIATVYVEVRSELSTLTGEDSDGDLIPDLIEGYQDEDGDGIPDYLDRIDECNVLQEEALVYDGYLIEGQPGVCLRRGNLTIGGQTGGAQITDSDIDKTEGDELIKDPDAINVGGIFDYIAYGLPDNAMTFAIVMPQRKPIPTNAVYRKFTVENGWGFFIENERNSLWSTQGEAGYCPPPNDDMNDNVWTLGLSEGHWCVQQIIEDGGVNDDDKQANGTIVDPGGVGVMITSNHLPVAVDDHIEIFVNEIKTIDVLVNDTDEDNDYLSITSATANIGAVSIVDNQLIYNSANNYAGTILIDYGISDNNGGTDHATVSIEVVVNTPPVVVDEDSRMNQVQANTKGGGALQFFGLCLLLIIVIRRQYQKYEK